MKADDPRFVATVAGIEKELKRGDFVYRYVDADDFGVPENAFVVCSFWFVNALAALGRRDEARELFDVPARMPQPARPARRASRRRRRCEPWGNFVQTYSMVGLITSAIRLSIPWDEAF